MSVKLVGVWILGALFMLGGVWVVQNLELTLGVPETSYMLALAVSFVLFLLAGLSWISVAVATRKKFI
jgi:hypothetical protein